MVYAEVSLRAEPHRCRGDDVDIVAKLGGVFDPVQVGRGGAGERRARRQAQPGGVAGECVVALQPGVRVHVMPDALPGAALELGLGEQAAPGGVGAAEDAARKGGGMSWRDGHGGKRQRLPGSPPALWTRLWITSRLGSLGRDAMRSPRSVPLYGDAPPA
jgi:hypothetical protein